MFKLQGKGGKPLLPIILSIIAGIYIFINGMMKGVLQVKIQVLDNNGYTAGGELKSNRINFFARWIVFILVFFFIGWVEAIILLAVNLIGFFISFKMTKDKYIDTETNSLKQEVFEAEIGNNPLYKRKQEGL